MNQARLVAYSEITRLQRDRDVPVRIGVDKSSSYHLSQKGDNAVPPRVMQPDSPFFANRKIDAPPGNRQSDWA
jgi:hypothetical protein